MIYKKKRITLSLMILLGIVLASALVFLYAKTRDYDASAYFENIALLRQIKQLDARWELDAIKSKVGLNKTYDPLVDPLKDITGLQRQLTGITSSRQDALVTSLNAQIKEFEGNLQKKNQLS